MKNKKPLVPLFLAAVFLTGCSTSFEIIAADRTYQAYGKTWNYHEIHHHSTGWGFNTPQGIIGKVSKFSQSAYLNADSGEKIPVHERIFVLQKDGNYRKISCCDNPGAFINLYQLEGKLILGLAQTRENVTDCWAYPAGMSINYMSNKRRLYRISFYADFNPVAERFELKYFVPVLTSQAEITKKYGYNPDRNQFIELGYSKRTPLICDDDAIRDAQERDQN